MIRKLEWDSDFFGCNIAHIDINGELGDLSFIENFRETQPTDLVQCCCAVSDLRTIRMLEDYGFHFADLRIDYSASLDAADFPACEPVTAQVEDLPALKEIAQAAFRDSRYHHDRFDSSKVRSFYETWLEKSIQGSFDDVCLKVSEQGPAGFVTVKFLEDRAARIGLLGVKDKCRNKGIGTKLLQSLFTFLRERNTRTVEVATQGRNIKANNFYIRNGFLIRNIRSWYYF
jgi:dTDP-4-amino-4,6-dideoxy-D-galactose acyltransferase